MNLKHDDRLKLLENGRYELWHDGQKIGVPYGQSTTQPKQRELIACNTAVYGEIKNGFFQHPCVDFTNTQVNVERFDKFCLPIIRQGEDLPTDEEVDFPTELGINNLLCFADIEFSLGEFKGYFNNIFELHFINDKTWQTTILHFDNFLNQNLYGDFILSINPTDEQLKQGILFDTSQTIKENMILNLILKRAVIENGLSNMPLLVKNGDYKIDLKINEFKMIRGES